MPDWRTTINPLVRGEGSQPRRKITPIRAATTPEHADEQSEEKTIESLIDGGEPVPPFGSQLSDIRVGRHFVWIESGQLPHQLLRTVRSEYIGKTV